LTEGAGVELCQRPGWQVFAAEWKNMFFSMEKPLRQKIVFAGKNCFLPLVGKITIKSSFATA